MDFDSILSAYKTKTCIMSVESYEDGGYGNIRIAAGNKAHCDDMINVMHKPFIPDSPYDFAIGMHVVSDKEDIRIAMRNADQGMYTDKKEYYENHPDRRRR